MCRALYNLTWIAALITVIAVALAIPVRDYMILGMHISAFALKALDTAYILYNQLPTLDEAVAQARDALIVLARWLADQMHRP